MKKIIFSILALSLIACSFSCQEKIDIEQEKEAIIAVMEGPTDAYLDKDFDRFAAAFVQDETLAGLTANKSGYRYNEGWAEISSFFKEYVKNNPEPSTIKHEKTNYKIKVYKESAWAIFDESSFYSDGEIRSKSIGVRILEKVNGEWKIAYISFISTSSYDEEVEEEESKSEE